MAYGHAERTLDTIRLLEAETMALLSRQDRLDPEQEEWLRDTARFAVPAPRRPQARCREAPFPPSARAAEPARIT